MLNSFLPIAGANEVGASSYFLKIDGINILLDCGARTHAQIAYPDYSVLLDEQIDDYGQIDIIVISHAHYDHIGSFYSIASCATNAKIYATKLTKELMRLQLIDFERSVNSHENEKVRRIKLQRIEIIIDNIIELPVMKVIEVCDCKIKLFPAGHMAGASMVGLETENHKVLYTGDFSFNTIMGMNSINISGFKPDVLILNATYGYSYGDNKGLDYKGLEKKINEISKKDINILLKSTSIAKHLDLFYALKMMRLNTVCYIHPSSARISDAFSDLSYNIYSENIKFDEKEKLYPHVMISEEGQEGYQEINVDRYSLHASYSELLDIIYMCMPKQIFVVHTNVKEDCLNFMDDLYNQGRYRGSIIQCENEMTYEIQEAE